jgi:hypothetical protein
MSSRLVLTSLLVAGGVAAGFTGVFSTSSPAEAATGLLHCSGSRSDVLDCCERSIKPVWWKRSGNKCTASAVRCFKVRDPAITHVNSGKLVCYLVQLENSSGKRKTGGGKPNEGRQPGGKGPNSSAGGPIN